MANKPRLRFKGIFATIKAVQKCTVFLCLRGHRECTHVDALSLCIDIADAKLS